MNSLGRIGPARFIQVVEIVEAVEHPIGRTGALAFGYFDVGEHIRHGTDEVAEHEWREECGLTLGSTRGRWKRAHVDAGKAIRGRRQYRGGNGIAPRLQNVRNPRRSLR